MKTIRLLILSDCHNSEAHWTPEYGSKAYRQSTPLRAKANDRPKVPAPPVEDRYVKPMRWTKGEAKRLRAWRREFGYSQDRGGFRSTNIANVKP
jgi:hypothetical protein